MEHLKKSVLPPSILLPLLPIPSRTTTDRPTNKQTRRFRIDLNPKRPTPRLSKSLHLSSLSLSFSFCYLDILMILVRNQSHLVYHFISFLYSIFYGSERELLQTESVLLPRASLLNLDVPLRSNASAHHSSQHEKTAKTDRLQLLPTIQFPPIRVRRSLIDIPKRHRRRNTLNAQNLNFRIRQSSSPECWNESMNLGHLTCDPGGPLEIFRLAEGGKLGGDGGDGGQREDVLGRFVRSGLREPRSLFRWQWIRSLIVRTSQSSSLERISSTPFQS